MIVTIRLERCTITSDCNTSNFYDVQALRDVERTCKLRVRKRWSKAKLCEKLRNATDNAET